MFSWSADTVRFMADACRRTDFHEKLTALLLPYLKPTDHICDAGCGLEAAQMARLFEPFFTTKAEGLGLGMSLSKSIIESFGGSLSAHANADAPGLTVWFRLPEDTGMEAHKEKETP